MIQLREHYTWFLIVLIIFFSSLIISKKISFHSNTEDLRKLLNRENTIKQCLFSSKHNITQALVDLINHEQKSIKAAIYLLTDKNITKALIDAKKRNIDIQIITCGSNMGNKFNKINMLQDNDITIYIYNSTKKNNDFNSSLMHNKFFIFEKNLDGKCILWTGSFNCTITAQKKNKENVLIISDKYLCGLYIQEFEDIKNETKVLKHYNHSFSRNKKYDKPQTSWADEFRKTFRIVQ